MPSVASSSPALWQVEITLPRAALAPLEAALAEISTAQMLFEADEARDLWTLQAICPERPDPALLGPALALAAAAGGVAEPEPIILRLESRDWLSASAAAFPPLTIGRFHIHGSHHADRRPPVGSHPLLVDAATAFGSGDHDSTRGCLLALDALTRRIRPARCLDVGCGSGILALAAARAFRRPALAVDIDAESVRVARFNARRNGLAALVRVWLGNGVQDPALRARGPYDLIFANILARPLTRMARDLAPLLAPGGHLVLAGLLTRQENQVLAAYRLQGLVLVRRLRLTPWTTLVLGRDGAGRPAPTASLTPTRVGP